ncbi:lasso RiPP family leader peptide-containing protein [Ruania zhangjianzhongii]|nr:lasso RiPP family leader peptide-containing protein [Ruania zhangjianzhongii]
MSIYEAPMLTEVGSVREMTLGGANLQDWSDEIRLWKVTIPLPGEFS